MHKEMKDQPTEPKLMTDEGSERDDPIWQGLANYQLTLPLVGLLKLMLRFIETFMAIIKKEDQLAIPIHFTNPSRGSTVLDEQNPSMKVIMKGTKLPGAIIDGGSRVNVISKKICDKLGIQEWEACPFSLWMADTSSVHPLELIRNLDITIGRYPFAISVVMLQLDAPRVYPLLLGRPWLQTTNIKQN